MHTHCSTSIAGILFCVYTKSCEEIEVVTNSTLIYTVSNLTLLLHGSISCNPKLIWDRVPSICTCIALSFLMPPLHVAIHLVSCKQFALNVPQVRGGEDGCNIDAFDAVIASRRHCVPAFRQAKATTFSLTGVKRIRLFTMTS